MTATESDAEVAAEKTLGLASAISASAATNAVDVADGLSNAEYRKLIWKLDVHLLPPLFVLWFISLIDRVNIGTARIQGLEKDLGMNPLTNQFNIATVVVFIGLMLAEVIESGPESTVYNTNHRTGSK
ncbi:hypothetical protein ACHAPV_009353 [Trichoderma viride]